MTLVGSSSGYVRYVHGFLGLRTTDDHHDQVVLVTYAGFELHSAPS